MTNSAFIDNDKLDALYPAHVKELIARHDRALAAAGASHAVIFSGAPRPVFLDDYNHPFKPNPHFVSWLPVTDVAGSYLVITPGEQPKLIYFQEMDYWHSMPEDPSGYWTPYFDIHVINSADDVAPLLPQELEKCVLIGEIFDGAQAQGIERINPSTAMNILHYARGIKTEYEIECMRQASVRGVAGHRAAEQAFREGMPEFDIHLAYCKACEHGDNELPYGNIVALNENGAVLHYQHRERQAPADIRSFLIDAGAQVHRYASDITRTYAMHDGFFAELVADFDDLQRSLVTEVVAGASFADVHLMTHSKIADFLIAHDFASGSAEALVTQGVTATFYPHGLGHLLGLQVHDMGGFMADESGTTIDQPSGHPFLRLTRQLEANMVVTVEPGIYVIDMLLDNLKGTPAHSMVNFERVADMRPYGGIRIEDNVRVLEGGNENMTRDAFSAAN